jgi:hypothetical protein
MSFNVTRYKKPTNQDGKQLPDTLVDGSDYLANERELVISFKHVPSGESVSFKAFITSFNESYNSNFNPTVTYGRTDPIYQYSNTTRAISLGFSAPAASESEAYENLMRISKLERFLYASYTNSDVANTITQAPLIRLKVMNLLQNSKLLKTAEGEREIFSAYTSDSSPDQGLLGVVTSLTVDHNLQDDNGVFYKQGTKNTILPKLITVQVSFSPIHEETIGWRDQEAINSMFPYGAIEDEDRSAIRGNKNQREEANERSSLYLPKTSTFREQVEKEKAEEQARKVRQQQFDNAEARYGGVLGDLRLNRDERRMTRGNQRAADRLQGLADVSDYQAGSGEFNFDEGFVE